MGVWQSFTVVECIKHFGDLPDNVFGNTGCLGTYLTCWLAYG